MAFPKMGVPGTGGSMKPSAPKMTAAPKMAASPMLGGAPGGAAITPPRPSPILGRAAKPPVVAPSAPLGGAIAPKRSKGRMGMGLRSGLGGRFSGGMR